MSTRSLCIALVCLFAFPVAASAAGPGPGAGPLPDPEEQAFCQTINAYRAQNGLRPLRLSIALTNASKWMSASMARNDNFDHTDVLGRDFSRRISAFRYRGSTRGENIAAGTDGSARAMFDQWKSSAPHRRNMLSRSYKVIGIGRAYNPSSMFGWYWTTDFGGTVDRSVPC